MRSYWLATAMACGVLLSAGARASADPIPLTGGALGFAELGPAAFTLRTATFEIVGDLSGGLERFGPFDDCFIGSCVAGSSFDVSASLAGYLGHGPAVIDGESHEDLHFFGSVDITGPPGIVPDVGGSGHTVGFFPFSLTATVAAYAERSEASARLLAADVFGSGMVRIVFRANATDPPTIRTSDTSYQIASSDPAPVPEPATLLLVGTGGALAMARRRRSSRRGTFTV